jgi:hypothetical protein
MDLIVVVIDRERTFPYDAHLGDREVLEGHPEVSDLLIPADKFDFLDPERGILGGLPHDFDNRKVSGVNPDVSFKQILVFAERGRLGHETVVAVNLLCSDNLKNIVCGSDRTVPMALAFGCIRLTVEEAPENQPAND